jgi:acyl carrier protein
MLMEAGPPRRDSQEYAMSQVKSVVHEVLKSVADEESLSIAEIRGDEKLVEDLGFRSLTMARILAILEARLGVDPFSKTVAVTSIRTVDDLCGAYRQCLTGEGESETTVSPEVDQSRRRAASRLDAARRRTPETENA